jgi:hypothetical protein
MPTRPDTSIYSQVLISAADFAAAAREAAEWLDQHEDNVTMIEIVLRFGESEQMPIEGAIRFTDG